MTSKQQSMSVLDRIFVGVLVVIFAGIVIHTPLAVWLGTVFPAYELFIKGWKEVLMLVAGVLAMAVLWRKNRWDVLKSKWMLLVGAYGLLHLLLVPLFYDNASATIAGLMIDLRYVLYFALVVIAVRVFPQLRDVFVWVFLGGALLIALTALLQVFVLPPDVLTVLGYGDMTIQPYLTVDENPDFVRINGTLRGPNPLGAYAVIALSVLVAYVARVRRSWKPRWWVIAGLVMVGSLVALWASYSRSALIGAGVALGIIFLLTIGRRLPRWIWIGLFVAGFALVGGVYAARETPFVTNVILHENEGTGAVVSSNDGHVDSLVDGTERLVRQPLGAGVGSTGSASLLTDEPVIIENQYLFIAHESGWIGLVLFLMLFVGILRTTWRERADWLALAVLASGLGLALIGVLLPVWVDDTVSIIWWGLAGVIIGGTYVRTIDKAPKRTA